MDKQRRNANNYVLFSKILDANRGILFQELPGWLWGQFFWNLSTGLPQFFSAYSCLSFEPVRLLLAYVSVLIYFGAREICMHVFTYCDM